MPTKKPLDGLSPRHVRLIRRCLVTAEDDPEYRLALRLTWIGLVYSKKELFNPFRDSGLPKGTLAALVAGIETLRRKRIGRLFDCEPAASFWALGIITPRWEALLRERVPFRPAPDVSTPTPSL